MAKYYSKKFDDGLKIEVIRDLGLVRISRDVDIEVVKFDISQWSQVKKAVEKGIKGMTYGPRCGQEFQLLPGMIERR